MAINIWEDYGRELTAGDSATRKKVFHITGVSDDFTAAALLDGATLAQLGSLWKQSLKVSEEGPEHYLGTITYGPMPLRKPVFEMCLSFDTTGGTQKITQAFSEVSIDVPAGATAPEFNGAIGVKDDGVEGVDIVVPVFNWVEQWSLPKAMMTGAAAWEYAKTLSDLTGTKNAATFRTFAAGEVLFLGATGEWSTKDADYFSISYKFSRLPNREEFDIGEITVASKRGHDYMWVRYQTSEDSAAKCLVQTPMAVIVDEVYPDGDFSLLGIG